MPIKYKILASTAFQPLEKMLNAFSLDVAIVGVQFLSHGGFVAALVTYETESEASGA